MRKDRNKMGGGVAIYVENYLKFRVREDLITDFEVISIELGMKYVKPIVVRLQFTVLPEAVLNFVIK